GAAQAREPNRSASRQKPTVSQAAVSEALPGRVVRGVVSNRAHLGRRPGRGGAERSGLAGIARRAGGVDRVVGVLLLGWDGIDAGQPAVEIDVGAALGTERAKALDLRLAADYARSRRGIRSRHGLDLSLPRRQCERGRL